jgi:hypothetical protein
MVNHTIVSSVRVWTGRSGRTFTQATKKQGRRVLFHQSGANNEFHSAQ